MKHLTTVRGDPQEEAAAETVRDFLRKYESYFERSGHAYLGGASGMSFLDCQLIPHITAHLALWRRVKRTEMLAGFPHLQRWHDALVRRDSFRRTWPQGYSLEGAYAVVAEMAVDKAQSMYGFEFPDLVVRQNDGSCAALTKTVAVARGDTGVKHDLGAYCL